MDGLLNPVWAGTIVADLTGDEALLRHLLNVEAVWAETLADAGLASCQESHAIRRIADHPAEVPELTASRLAAEAPSGGNPVIPMVKALRESLTGRGEPDAALHRAATSQDIMDTALMLAAREGTQRIVLDARRAADALADLAHQHRGTVCIARTLTQYALPTSFGVRVAGWLDGIHSAATQLEQILSRLPIQWAGAVGTQAGLTEAYGTESARTLTSEFARRLGLADPGRSWQVQRQPVVQLGSALGGLIAAWGKAASDVLILQRPEVAELFEPQEESRGGSTAMPQKQNPILSVLIRSASLSAPGHVSTLLTAAALSVDERPDGAWQAEWPALRELLRLAGGASCRGAELFEGLVVNPSRMRQNLDSAGMAVYSERIVEALKEVHSGGPAGVRDTIRRSVVDGQDLLTILRSEIPDERVGAGEFIRIMEEMTDPQHYLGRADEFISAAISAYEEVQT